MKPLEKDTAEAHLHDNLRAAMAAIDDQQSVTLRCAELGYRGVPAGDASSSATQWRIDIGMSVGDDDEESGPAQLTVGFLELWTVLVDESVAETLDSVSADTAEYLQLFSGDAISADVSEQFDSPFCTGLMILDRAYLHPAVRGRGLAAWAVVNAVRDLTFGSIGVFVVAHPTPTEKRSGISTAAAAKKLARYWGDVGLVRIRACPNFIGQTTAVNAFEDAHEALSGSAELEIILPVRELQAR